MIAKIKKIVSLKIIMVLLFLASINSFAQTTYAGFIDKYPIEFVTDIDSDGSGRGIYTYSNYDTPIEISGTLKNKILTFFEKDKADNKTGKMVFENFNSKSKKLEGTWTDLNTKKELKISLTKVFDIDYGDNIEWKNREILQAVSLKGKYFKLIVSKSKGDFYAKVTGVKILEKKTDKVLQQIELECQLWGLNNISTDDYNFDGIEDFSVFEGGTAGPNTTSLYFLYNPKTEKYFESSFSGTSLEFDSKTKRIHEYNQCCAGASQMNAEYKVVNNKMVLIKKSCLELDIKSGELKKVKCD
ncbi:XAC2610-related protein [Flavobacterium aquidurense]|uniref:Lipoprotein n=1 Tax=Flavobacterium aquidurense TaxID=362413 RepID=A0A0Q1B9U3_9FLAO|nr:hypothetical protein [Flavobacterium aquidurense]KQB37114.1 hypothetical protein RC62_2280 [Flavobacterium aquidurense]